MKKSIKTMCGICMSGGCGVTVEVDSGRIDKVTPLKGHPLGVICVRADASHDIVFAEDRLLYPMRRVGKKGEGKFESISWDEALDTVARRMNELKEKYGAASVAEYSGRGGWFEASILDMFNAKGTTSGATKNFLFPFGSPNAGGVGSVCYQSYGILAPIPTLGMDMRSVISDFNKSNLIVLWGANPSTDSPPNLVESILNARRRGAKVIVIDPLHTDTADKSDKWIPIRPGTDGALALGMMNVIISEGLYDREFVERWTVGFEELKQYVAQFTPKEVERITWVPAPVVEETARAIATARHATFRSYTGLEYTASGVQNLRALFILWAITGNYDVPGGNLFRMQAKNFRPNLVALEPPAGVKPIGADKYPLFHKYVKSAHFTELPAAVLEGKPYPIKGFILAGASLIVSFPNPALWHKVLEALEFLVVIDRHMTRDGQYADIILPACTLYETSSYWRYPSYVQLRERVIEPRGESKPDYWIYKELADRLGYGHLYPPYEKLADFVFRGSGVDIEVLREKPEGVPLEMPEMVYKKYEQGMLRQDGAPGFETPSGKVEITSSILKEYGYDPLPVYTEPKESPLSRPDLAREFPLVFTSGARLSAYFRSQHQNIPRLLKLHPKPLVTIHPHDASARDIKDGDSVLVVTPRGQVRFTAYVTEDIIPGVVEVNAGGGAYCQPEEWREANVNYLTSLDDVDPISGFPVYKALLCNVRKIGS